MNSIAKLSIVPNHVAPVAEGRPSGIRLRAPRPTQARTVPTELRASEVTAVARREIEWFFTTDATDSASDSAPARIEGWLRALSHAEQQTLALGHEPLPCPPSLAVHCGEGFALVLSLAFAGHWRPNGYPRHAAERAASHQLAAAVTEHGPGILAHIQRRAEWDVTSAVAAYVRARGRVPSVLPVER
jgi:hypothetical protein